MFLYNTLYIDIMTFEMSLFFWNFCECKVTFFVYFTFVYYLLHLLWLCWHVSHSNKALKLNWESTGKEQERAGGKSVRERVPPIPLTLSILKFRHTPSLTCSLCQATVGLHEEHSSKHASNQMLCWFYVAKRCSYPWESRNIVLIWTEIDGPFFGRVIIWLQLLSGDNVVAL